MPDRPITPLDVFAFQADQCGRAGSPLYERILTGLIADARAGGVTARVLADHGDDPFGSALALRLLGAVHRLVLEGRAPELAALYPSAGGDPSAGDPVPPFLAVLEDHWDEVTTRITAGVQTNEVGRAPVLAGGYAEVLRRTGLPLRILEIGASAGLNLRFDRYAYVTPEGVAGDPGSAVRFDDVWDGDPPLLPACFEVAERRGCDRNPLDAASEDGRLTLLSYMWPDQGERILRLEAALAIAAHVPVDIDQADAADWVEAQLARPRPGVATVVTHSIVFQYLTPDRRRRVRGALEHAGRSATPDAPVSWLRLEPAGDVAELRLTQWPRGDDEALATAGFHGSPVRWLAPHR